jgi:isochorismate hydrolase
MSIPAIMPYPMPAAAELPENRVSWRADPDRAVLLVHDMQRYFVEFFPAGRSPRTDLIANVGRLRAWARGRGVPVVYSAQPGGMTPAQRGLLRDFWGAGMSTDPRSREIVPEVRPGPGDAVVTKWRYSAFARTELESLIRGHGRDQLVICGVYAHVGCLMTACDAFTADIQPFLVADAVADFTADEHRLALDYAARRCAMTVTTDQVVAARSAASAAAPGAAGR